MKNLNTILRPCTLQFPVLGQNGYAGEQDGTRVIFDGILMVSSRKEAKTIQIGNAIKIHWASYSHQYGWEISLVHWSNADEKECQIIHTEKE